MCSKYITLLLLLCTCAAPVSRREERRVPRGWTLDTSKQDLAAVNIREQKAFGEGKIIHADDFGAESLTTEATLSSTDGKAQLRHLIEERNKLVCINKALEDAVKEHEDRSCFATLRDIQMLEVHVETSISALRKEDKWPQFKVLLGGKDSEEFAWAHALDRGTVVFRKRFTVKQDGKDMLSYNMKEAIREITFELNTVDRINNGYVNDYVTFKDSFGSSICLERHLWGNWGTCKRGRETQLKNDINIETNRLHIDRVEIYISFADDDRAYKVFASRSSAQEPLVILDNIVRQYSIAGFDNNPYWLLHYHSARCEPWQEDHDGSEFGEHIFNEYIKKKNNSSINIYDTPLHCTGVFTVPVYDTPDIPDLDINDIKEWLNNNEASFKPHANNDEAECQPRTAAIVIKEASEQNKCGKEPGPPLEIPTDLDTWSAARLSRKVTDRNSKNNTIENSNVKHVTNLNKITGSGCFYEKQLLGGMAVSITGQVLVNAGGKLMTRAKANACIGGVGEPSDDNNVYINLGLNKLSYPLITNNSGTGNDARIKLEAVIDAAYTENFALRDIKFVHFEKTASAAFSSYQVVSTVKQVNKGVDKVMDGVSILVEQGIIAISSITISFDGAVLYQRGSSPSSAEEEGETEEIDCNKNDVLGAEFVLSSSNNVWVDYNVHGNEKWEEYRDEKDHCVAEE